MSDYNPAMNAYDPNFGKRASVSSPSAAEKPSNAPNACDPSPATAIIETLADQAKKLVYGDRNQQYGSPAKDYERVSKVWSGLLCNKLKDGESITAEEALIMMTSLKLCREFHKHKDDNIIDAHGYLECLHWVLSEKENAPNK